MRNAILISILTVVLAVGAASVFAGPPLNGTYKTADGDFDEGRELSAWNTSNGYLGIDNVLHAESWDGVALGGDWKIVCPQVVAVSLVADLVFGGNGHRIYKIDYAGGTVELDGGGPWGNGDPVYVGLIDTYTEIRTVQFVAGAKVGAVSDHSVTAHLQGYPETCMTWGIGNGAWLGEGIAPPPGYPTFLDEDCNVPPVTFGAHWGPFSDLTISVTGCAVPTQEATWGSVKSLYRD